MPRNLQELSSAANEDTIQGMSELSKENAAAIEDDSPAGAESEEKMIDALLQKSDKRDQLHPYTQSLKLSDVESCVRLEEETFPPNERCTREKVSP